MDRRWHLALDCPDAEHPLFSKGTLVTFRGRLLARDPDRRLIGRTVELAARTKGFGSRPLRAALDSSPQRGRAACRWRGRVAPTLSARRR